MGEVSPGQAWSPCDGEKQGVGLWEPSALAPLGGGGRVSHAHRQGAVPSSGKGRRLRRRLRAFAPLCNLGGGGAGLELGNPTGESPWMPSPPAPGSARTATGAGALTHPCHLPLARCPRLGSLCLAPCLAPSHPVRELGVHAPTFSGQTPPERKWMARALNDG